MTVTATPERERGRVPRSEPSGARSPAATAAATAPQLSVGTATSCLIADDVEVVLEEVRARGELDHGRVVAPGGNGGLLDGAEERTIVSRTGASRCVAIGGIVTVSPSEFSETVIREQPANFQNSRSVPPARSRRYKPPVAAPNLRRTCITAT